MRPCRVSFRLVSRRFRCFSFTIGCGCSYDDVMLFPDGVFDDVEDDDDEPTTKCTGSKYSVHESLLLLLLFVLEFELVFTVVVVAVVEFDIFKIISKFLLIMPILLDCFVYSAIKIYEVSKSSLNSKSYTSFNNSNSNR